MPEPVEPPEAADDQEQDEEEIPDEERPSWIEHLEGRVPHDV